MWGTKEDAQRVAAELTLTPSRAAGRTVATLLDAWLEIGRVPLLCALEAGQ